MQKLSKNSIVNDSSTCINFILSLILKRLSGSDSIRKEVPWLEYIAQQFFKSNNTGQCNELCGIDTGKMTTGKPWAE